MVYYRGLRGVGAATPSSSSQLGIPLARDGIITDGHHCAPMVRFPPLSGLNPVVIIGPAAFDLTRASHTGIIVPHMELYAVTNFELTDDNTELLEGWQDAREPPPN